jgi:hypothetical protein
MLPDKTIELLLKASSLDVIVEVGGHTFRCRDKGNPVARRGRKATSLFGEAVGLPNKKRGGLGKALEGKEENAP